MSVKIILTNGNEHTIPDLTDVTGRVITELSKLNISSMVTAYLTENGVNIDAEDVEQIVSSALTTDDSELTDNVINIVERCFSTGSSNTFETTVIDIVNESVLYSSNETLQDAVRSIANEFCFSTTDGTSSFAPALIEILNDPNNPVLDSSNEKLQNALKDYLTYEVQADSTTKLIAINPDNSKFEGYDIDTAGDFTNEESIATIKSLNDLESALIGDLTCGRTSNKADVYIPNITILTDEALPATGTTGDYCIIKDTEAGTQTAYMYLDGIWQALNGNYTANNIYFDDDMMVTTDIGYIKTSNGSGTIPSKGKNLAEVFEAMFVEEQDPTTTDPSVSITLTKAGSYEVGTTVTGIAYTANFEDGNYSFGPDPTGATVTSWEITTSTGDSFTTTSEDLPDLLVTDETSFKVTAKATHTAGDTPKTNKQNDCTDTSKIIAAGTKSKSSSAITGYRSYFYGAISVATSALTSEIIRGLTNGGNYNNKKSFTIAADGADNLKAFIVAIPVSNTRAGIIKVDSTTGMTVGMTDSYNRLANIAVADARGTIDGINQNTTEYKIYAWEPASIDPATVHEFTLG